MHCRFVEHWPLDTLHYQNCTCQLVHLCRLFHLTHKHILDKYSAQITIWLFFYCCTHSFSLPSLLLPLLPLPPSLMFSPLSSHLSLPPSLFLWLFVVPSLSLLLSLSSHFFTSICPYHLAQLRYLYHPPISLSPEVHLPMAEEKDYFTVTDELSRENSHFALSEALLVVIEQVGWQ